MTDTVEPSKVATEEPIQTQIETDAAGSPIGDQTGSPASESPEPSPPAPAAETQPSSASPAPTEAPTSVHDVIADYEADTTEAKNAIVDLSNAIKSAVSTIKQVVKSETQSLDMQTGAQVAADTAKQSLLKKWSAVVTHFGEEVAADIRADLAKLHDAEAVVTKVFKLGGA